MISFLRGGKTTLKIKTENLKLEPGIISPCLALGLATFIMQSSESIIAVCFNSSLLRYGGDLAVGAMTILTSVKQLIILPLNGIAQGVQPISSYNYGAGNTERVKKTFRLLLICSLSFSVLLWGGVMLAPRAFAGIFTPDPVLLDFTAGALRIYCGALFMLGIQMACQMTFVSIGNAPCSIIVAIMRKFVLLLPLIYTIPLLVENKTNGVYLAEPIADFVAVCFTAMLFTVQFRRAMKRIVPKADAV